MTDFFVLTDIVAISISNYLVNEKSVQPNRSAEKAVTD
jgi:hypothetical protein